MGWSCTHMPSTSLILARAPFLLCASLFHFLCVPGPWANALLSLATRALIWPVPHPALQLLLLALVQHSQQQDVALSSPGTAKAGRAGFQDSRANQGARALDNWELSPDSFTPFRLRRDPQRTGRSPTAGGSGAVWQFPIQIKNTLSIGPTDKGQRVSTQSLIYECSEQLFLKKIIISIWKEPKRPSVGTDEHMEVPLHSAIPLINAKG